MSADDRFDRVVWFVCAFAAGVLVRDYTQDWRDEAAKNRTVKEAPAPMRSEPGAINPRCREPSAGWIAKQPDGERWTVHCLKGTRT